VTSQNLPVKVSPIRTMQPARDAGTEVLIESSTTAETPVLLKSKDDEHILDSPHGDNNCLPTISQETLLPKAESNLMRVSRDDTSACGYVSCISR
jgi:hypothetical protein